MSDRISVRGSSWAEARSDVETVLYSETHVKVSIFGVGDKIAKGIEQGAARAFGDVPKRAETFMRMRADRSLASTTNGAQGDALARRRLQALHKGRRLRAAVLWSRVRLARRQGRLQALARWARVQRRQRSLMRIIATAVREVSRAEHGEPAAAQGCCGWRARSLPRSQKRSPAAGGVSAGGTGKARRAAAQQGLARV